MASPAAAFPTGLRFRPRYRRADRAPSLIKVTYTYQINASSDAEPLVPVRLPFWRQCSGSTRRIIGARSGLNSRQDGYHQPNPEFHDDMAKKSPSASRTGAAPAPQRERGRRHSAAGGGVSRYLRRGRARWMCCSPTTDFGKIEQGKDKPSGGATSRGSVANASAFSLSSGTSTSSASSISRSATASSAGLGVRAGLDRLDGWARAAVQFARLPGLPSEGRAWPSAASTEVPDNSGSMLVRLSVPAATQFDEEKLEAHSVNSLPDPTYGGQLQDRSMQGHEGEGRLGSTTPSAPSPAGGGVLIARAAFQLVDSPTDRSAPT